MANGESVKGQASSCIAYLIIFQALEDYVKNYAIQIKKINRKAIKDAIEKNLNKCCKEALNRLANITKTETDIWNNAVTKRSVWQVMISAGYFSDDISERYDKAEKLRHKIAHETIESLGEVTEVELCEVAQLYNDVLESLQSTFDKAKEEKKIVGTETVEDLSRRPLIYFALQGLISKKRYKNFFDIMRPSNKQINELKKGYKTRKKVIKILQKCEKEKVIDDN